MNKERNHNWNQGFTQVYTGNGKGKTTAAIGLSVRAAGAGLHVFFGQFLKGMDYSELHSLKSFERNITVRQFGSAKFVMGKPASEDINNAREGVRQIEKAIESGEYDIVVLDEANGACSIGIIDTEWLVSLIKNKPSNVELIITGRDAAPAVIELADLVTEMKEIKHYYEHDIPARRGIEK